MSNRRKSISGDTRIYYVIWAIRELRKGKTTGFLAAVWWGYPPPPTHSPSLTRIGDWRAQRLFELLRWQCVNQSIISILKEDIRSTPRQNLGCWACRFQCCHLLAELYSQSSGKIRLRRKKNTDFDTNIILKILSYFDQILPNFIYTKRGQIFFSAAEYYGHSGRITLKIVANTCFTKSRMTTR